MPRRSIAAGVLVALIALSGCGDDDSSAADLIETDEWVLEFDRLCVETGERLSDPSLSEEDFAAISNAALAEMRSIGEPATDAAHAATLLEVIETESNGTDLSDEEIAEMEARFLEAATALGISDECLRGAQG